MLSKMHMQLQHQKYKQGSLERCFSDVVPVVICKSLFSSPSSKREFSDVLFIRSHSLAPQEFAKDWIRETGPKID